MEPVNLPQAEWYAEGLRFTCTQCGNCCTGPPGYVWFDDQEGEQIADHLGLDVATFRKKFAHRTFGRWSLKEHKNERGEYDCIFLTASGDGKRTCSIYPVRPTQCRTWPFWPENLMFPENWKQAAQRCPGMAKGREGQGKLYPIDQIRIIRDRNPQR